jgi:hypothetical protein
VKKFAKWRRNLSNERGRSGVGGVLSPLLALFFVKILQKVVSSVYVIVDIVFTSSSFVLSGFDVCIVNCG